MALGRPKGVPRDQPQTHCTHGHELTPENRTNDGQHCLTCVRRRSSEWAKANRKRHNANGKRWYDSHRSDAWKRWIFNMYHLTEEAWLALLEKQNNKCAVCERVFTGANKPCVDHNHACCSGKRSCGKCVRGLLCRGCNWRLEAIEAGGLERAKAYLAAYSIPQPKS